jgi:hypothetical protein
VNRPDFKNWVQEPVWLAGFAIAGLVSILCYLVNVLVSEVNPGNWWGITYGTIATLLMAGDVLYAAKRRLLRYNLGKSSSWVQFHLYGGVLFALFVLMHTGFGFPVGAMNWMLWVLSLWVTVSGLFGVLLQKWIPTILSSGLSIEALYDRIPELVAGIRESAEKIVAGSTETVKDFYSATVAGALSAPQYRAIYYLDVTGGIKEKMKPFDYVRPLLTGEEKDRLSQLEEMYRTKLELDAHYTLQRPLRWWLYTHVPLSFALVILVLLHLYAVLLY